MFPNHPPMVRLALYKKVMLRRKAAREQRAGDGAPPIPREGGASLPGDVRERMEGQLGADLSHAKVHTGAESAKAADEYGARALTVGSDVHFASGEYAPGTKEGDRLLAHELAHVVQEQRSGVQRKPEEGEAEVAEAADGVEVSRPGEPAEIEADAVGDAVAENLHDDGSDTQTDDEAVETSTDAGEVKEAAPAVGAKLNTATLPVVHLAPKYKSGREAGAASTIPARSPAQTQKESKQKAEQRRREQGPMPAEPVPRSTPHKPLSDAEREELKKKKAARTITKEENERLEWDRRMGNARDRAVDRFWRQEQLRLQRGQPPSRNWTPEQREAILKGEKPKGPDGEPIEGHHLYNVAEYPQHAANPGNITPVTKREHLDKWHGGNYQNETRGKPNKPDVRDCF
jgi:hypothetical protein